MRRDAIFYQIFQRYPDLIFEIAPGIPIEQRGYRFDSVEIKEPTFRIDGVFLPPANATPRPVIFAEIQFQKDDSIHHRFFAETFLYLYRNRTLYDNWHGILIFASRSLEPTNPIIHQALLDSPQVQRLYLDELGPPNDQPIGLSLIQLTLASEAQAPAQAQQLIQRVPQESTARLPAETIMEIITTIVVYKFAHLSREEVEAMLGLKLEESRIYQEAQAEGEHRTKLQMVPKLLQEGMSIERIASLVELPIEEVRQAIHPPQT